MRGVLRFLFVLYCIEVGIFLVVVPWSGAWERLLAPLFSPALQSFMVRPIIRGAVSGFGLVHLVWGAHDSLAWLQRRRSRDSLGT